MRELKEVMDKYPHLDRKFGIMLDHTHFDIKENEILHETHDKAQRVLTVNTIKKSELSSNAKATQWVFDEKGEIKVAQYCCDPPEEKN